MRIPTKATLEITEGGYTWKVFDQNNEVISNRSIQETSTGAKATKRGGFEDDFLNNEDLVIALDDSDPFDIMRALAYANDEDEVIEGSDEE